MALLSKVVRRVFLCSLLIGVLLGPAGLALGQDQPPQEEIDAVIQTLKDPKSRDQLIKQLEILAQAQQKPEKPSEVKSAAVEVLRGISKKVEGFTAGVMEFAGGINQLPQVLSWGADQLRQPEARAIWVEILVKISMVLAVGYLAFFVGRWLLRRPRRALAEKPSANYLVKGLRLLGLLVLDLLPVGVFALTTYLTLGLVEPRETTRLVALAWMNAFLIVQVLGALFNFFFAPAAPAQRLLPNTDETSHYFQIWSVRLSRTAVYGYFALQAALLLGLPQASYEILLRILGLVVAVLCIVLIRQNRATVSEFLAGREVEKAKRMVPQGLVHRFASIWHLMAIPYVLVLYGVWALQVEGGFLFMLRGTALSLLAILLGAAALHLINAYLRRGFKVKEDLRARFPGLEDRANRYLSTLNLTLRALVYVLVGLAILQAWGANGLAWLSSEPGRVLTGKVATIAGIVVISLVIWELASSLVEGYLNRRDLNGDVVQQSGRTTTLLTIARKTLLIVLTVFSSLMILSELGVNIGPLLAGAGVLGLAVGFGSQALVQDIITGVFILLEDQIAVGDVVNVGDKAGLVEAVSLRTVRLRDVSGTVHTIPYSAIKTVSNLTKEFSFSVFDVGVAYREDVDEVIEVLREVGAELQQDETYGPLILEPLDVLGLDKFADSAVVIRARLKTKPVKQWYVGREFNRRMKKKFDELGIEIPFPHTTVYFGENKGGGAPPAFVHVGSQVSALAAAEQPAAGETQAG